MTVDPTFTLEHNEQRWLIISNRKICKDYDIGIYLTQYGTGKITVSSFPSKGSFNFLNSDPLTVLAVGELIVAAARHAGAGKDEVGKIDE